jgi:hypothetical protein
VLTTKLFSQLLNCLVSKHVTRSVCSYFVGWKKVSQSVS